MKYFPIIASIGITLITIVSCTKNDPKYCWSCTTTVTTGANIGTSKSTICDKTTNEILAMEKAASTQSTGSSGGYTVTSYSSMLCSKM